MAVNDHALHTIEYIQSQSNSILHIIWPFRTRRNPDDDILQAFQSSLEVHSYEIQRLILELEVSIGNLNRLDEHLAVIHELCVRENLSVSIARDALLSDLWTILGGNRAQMHAFNANLELLRDLGQYRMRAVAHIIAAMETLRGMGEELEDLRESVATPDLVGAAIPLEVHIQSIRLGIGRLNERRKITRAHEEQSISHILSINA